MRLMRSLRAAGLVAVLLVASLALAQPTPTFSGSADRDGVLNLPRSSPGFASMYEESLEWMVANSEIIVRATIESVAADSVTFKITDTIKGKMGASSPRTVFRYRDTPAPKPGDDALLFIEENKTLTSQRYSLSLRWRQGFILLDGTMTVCLMDLSGLNDPQKIIAATRGIATYPADPTKKPLVLECTTPVGHKCLIMPVDQRLEKIAHRLLASYSVTDRILGSKAITSFQSDANAELVRRLLSDTRTRSPRGSGKWQLGHYHVRDAASDVLEKWQYGRPDLPAGGHVYVYRPLTVSRGSIIAVTGVVLFIIAMSIIPWRGRRILYTATLSILSIACIIAISLFWIRSRGTVDELMITSAGRNHEIASYRGGIQYQVMHDWTIETGHVYGSFDLKVFDDVWSSDNRTPKPNSRVGGFMTQKVSTVGPASVIHPMTFFRVPYWALLAPFPLILLRQLMIFLRQYRRRRLGLCRSCGYDLRESPGGRCPECGAGGRSLLAVASA
jgi:hypothetical protein